ncbi:hypothetical protein SAY86_011239 [Trapa natans]|uniref:NAC domain-containing protein n=1 Tax=Trapa natans TaxID=22666 RepID=A0AAN7LJW2_TRANT|nr:hypothetical protein SAY86_011239 [Trapa natans]
MRQGMNLSINGQSLVPPGFRFHPTEEELLHYYLRKKVAQEKIDLGVIREVDLNKLEPWDIQENCRIGSTPQSDWYFFSHKDKKYPTGTRTNRATAAGFWKATGRDKIIYSGFRRIGLRKTLVFYKGRAPHGQKLDWVMHEYRLDENPCMDSSVLNPWVDQSSAEEGWVVCRVFQKNIQKTLNHSPKGPSSTSLDSKLTHSIDTIGKLRDRNIIISDNPSSVLDQIRLYMGRNNACNMESGHLRSLVGLNSMSDCCDSTASDLHERFMHLPALERPTTLPSMFPTHSLGLHQQPLGEPTNTAENDLDHGMMEPLMTVGDWSVFDRLVASQLNGQPETPGRSAFGFKPADEDQEEEEEDDENEDLATTFMLQYQSDPKVLVEDGNCDFWSFTKCSSLPDSDPLRHLSV